MSKVSRACLAITLIAFMIEAADSFAQRKTGGAKKSRASARVTKRGKSTRATKRARSTNARKRGKAAGVAKRGKSTRGKVSRRGGRRRSRRTLNASRPPAASIPQERVTEIQVALIRAGYLEGPATTQYDEATTNAMKRFQSAHSLPRTGLPSAAALKLLGVPKDSGDGYSAPVKRVEGHVPPGGSF